MRILFPLAALFLVSGCKRSERVVLQTDSGNVSAQSGSTTRDTLGSASPSTLTCGVDENPTLSDQGVGELKIGRTVTEVKQLCEVVSDANKPGAEGMTEHIVAIRIGGEIVPATIAGDKIWRLAVSTPLIRTADSLGIDTPLRKIAAMRGSQFAPGEDGVYAFVAAHCGLSFRFSLPLRPPSGGQWTPTAIDKDHGDAAVDRVLVSECRK